MGIYWITFSGGLMNQSMLAEVIEGLKSNKKKIASKYFYDDRGSMIFKKISELEEYYLTRSEKEILVNSSMDIARTIGTKAVDLIELGPGDGSKAKIVARQFSKLKRNVTFCAVDISEKALTEVRKRFRDEEHEMETKFIVGEYRQALSLLEDTGVKKTKLVMFLGSSIGNMTYEEAGDFIREFSATLNSGDFFLIGFDLKKDVELLRKAYNDSQGITAKFNLNLLSRFNNELGANFNLDQFYHEEDYDDQLGAMVSYLVSKQDQSVHIGGHEITFKNNERIHTEYSFKFSKEDILNLIHNSGLTICKEYYDTQKYFGCFLFQKQEFSWQSAAWSPISPVRHPYPLAARAPGEGPLSLLANCAEISET
jgi:L-histidine N-alpha-methyltransferase